MTSFSGKNGPHQAQSIHTIAFNKHSGALVNPLTGTITPKTVLPFFSEQSKAWSFQSLTTHCDYNALRLRLSQLFLILIK